MQAWGLIVLLLSKAAGHLNVNEMEEDKAAGVLHRSYLPLTLADAFFLESAPNGSLSFQSACSG